MIVTIVWLLNVYPGAAPRIDSEFLCQVEGKLISDRTDERPCLMVTHAVILSGKLPKTIR